MAAKYVSPDLFHFEINAMKIRSFATFLIVALVATAGVSNAQITFGLVDDFSVAGDSADWVEGGNSPNAPEQNSGLGLDGLAGHLQNVSDGGGSGGRWHMWNDDARWSGDYLSAGVSQISFDFDNRSGNGVDANVRIGLNGVGGWFVSDAINVADGSDWQTLDFQLADLTHVAAGGGSGILSETLGSVARFEILSSVNTPTFAAGGNLLQGDNLVADFRVDNISAVPEPSGILLLIGAVSGLAIRRRK